TAVCQTYRQVFDRDLGQPNRRILFISSDIKEDRQQSQGSIRNLIDDLAVAAPSPAVLVPAGKSLMSLVEGVRIEAERHRFTIAELDRHANHLNSKANAELATAIAADCVLGVAGLAGAAGQLARIGRIARMLAKCQKIVKAVKFVKNWARVNAMITAAGTVVATSCHIADTCDRKSRIEVIDALNALHQLTPTFDAIIEAYYNKAL
ncbi:hypothetical protein BVRB_016820, partial [Beta vulgaris subsp. vulgaris]